MKNFKELKLFAEQKLSKTTTNPKQQFAFLCNELVGITAADLLIKEEINDKDYRKIKSAVKKLAKGYPLQLVIGYSDFCSVKIIESRKTLKPRLETELLVEEIIKRENKDSSVLDICAGTGCIGLALKKAGFEEVTVSDKSKWAIKQCIKNARTNHLPISIIRSDMFGAIMGKFDIIVSNPPYIPTKDIKNLSVTVKKYDPTMALDGGSDGLDFYRIIASKAPLYLMDGGVLYLEIGVGQENSIIKLLQNNFKNITIIKDYNNINRIIRAEKC